MLDGTYPQNAVTVAAWKLLDSTRELVPVAEETCAQTVDAVDAENDVVNEKKLSAAPTASTAPASRPVKSTQKKDIGKKMILPAAALVAGGIAGIAAALLFHGKRKK